MPHSVPTVVADCKSPLRTSPVVSSHLVPERNNRRWAYSSLGLAVAYAMGSSALAQTPSTATQVNNATLSTVEVIDFRGEQMDSLKYTRDLQDTPRLITVLPQDLLEEQNVTSLKDALRNVPGISLQAGEGNPPGGDQLKIRGFNARDDINVNGTRDLGNYFRDPFYVDQLEVVKGPNSAFSGRGSAGGTINFVTKKPLPETATRTNDGARLEVNLGTDNYKRTTLDLNKPLDLNSAVRINLMAHDAKIPGRDIAEESRYGLYGAYTWGFVGPTQITVDYLHLRQRDLPDAGLPFDRDAPGANANGTGALPPGLRFSSFYGHTNDYKDVDVDQLGLSVQHAFNSGTVLKNQTRLSHVHNDSITSSPRIREITPTFTGSKARGDLKPRDQKDQGFNNQTDVLWSFNTGAFGHDLVTGVEVGRYTYKNKRRPDVSGPLTDLYNPQPRPGPAAPYDGTLYGFETDEVGLYALDTIKLSEQWDLNAGIRWDRVKARAYEQGRAGGDNRDLSRTDTEASYSLGLVYKLNPKTSYYLSYGTSFNISGNFDRNQVQLAGGGSARVADATTFNAPPEQMTALEIGGKWKLASDLDVSAAVFRTQTKEGRFPGQAAGSITIPNANYQITGLELLAAGNLTKAWKLYAGYTNLHSNIKSAPSIANATDRAFVESQGLGGTPKHSFTLFNTYDVTPQWTLGAGLLYVSSQTSGVQPTVAGTRKVTIPSYTVVDLYASYKYSPKTQLRLGLYNAFDKAYISQVAEGGGQGIPGKARQLIATVRHDF